MAEPIDEDKCWVDEAARQRAMQHVRWIMAAGDDPFAAVARMPASIRKHWIDVVAEAQSAALREALVDVAAAILDPSPMSDADRLEAARLVLLCRRTLWVEPDLSNAPDLSEGIKASLRKEYGCG